MSVDLVHIGCDCREPEGGLCDCQYEALATSSAHAREVANLKGWDCFPGGPDLCPHCRDEGRTVPTAEKAVSGEEFAVTVDEGGCRLALHSGRPDIDEVNVEIIPDVGQAAGVWLKRYDAIELAGQLWRWARVNECDACLHPQAMHRDECEADWCSCPSYVAFADPAPLSAEGPELPPAGWFREDAASLYDEIQARKADRG